MDILDQETLDKHIAMATEGQSSFFYALAQNRVILVLVLVLAWILAVAFCVFIYLKYCKKKDAKDRMGPFIKINDGSVHMAQNGMWDNSTYNTGRMTMGR